MPEPYFFITDFTIAQNIIRYKQSFISLLGLISLTHLQKSLSKDELRKQINEDSKRLKENIELLKKQEGLTDKQIALRQQYREAKQKEFKITGRKIPDIKVNRFDEIVYRFVCPDCNSKQTKRTGLTTGQDVFLR